MYITVKAEAPSAQIAAVVARIEALGRHVHLSKAQGQTTIAVVGEGLAISPEKVSALPGVERVAERKKHSHWPPTIFDVRIWSLPLTASRSAARRWW